MQNIHNSGSQQRCVTQSKFDFVGKSVSFTQFIERIFFLLSCIDSILNFQLWHRVHQMQFNCHKLIS